MSDTQKFRALHHQQQPLIIANAWNVQSAQLIEKAGFKAIATSSGAVANSLGYPDGEKIPFNELLYIIGRIKANTGLPLSVDMERGYSDNPDELNDSLRHATKASDHTHIPIYEKTVAQVRKMNNLINGFLNVSRLESGKIHLNKISFRLDELIEELVGEVRLSAPSQTFELNCQEITVSADRDKIETVITNFLSNAVKYAKNQPIHVSCFSKGGEATVEVRDEGVGINPTDLNKLFERYYRVENNQTPHISGFGIDLYLSAEIIARHNGRIWAESELNKGATFYFTLPRG